MRLAAVLAIAAGCGRLQFEPLDDVDARPCTSLQQPVTTGADAHRDPDAALGAGRYALAWQTYDSTPIRHIDFALLRVPDGPRVVEHRIGAGFTPRVAWNQSARRFAVVYDDDGVYLQIVDAEGVLVGTPGRVSVGNNVARPHIVAAGDGFGLVWGEGTSPSITIQFARVDADGNAVVAPRTVATCTNDCYDAELAWNGNGFLIGWKDYVSGSLEVLSTDADGLIVGSGQTLAPNGHGLVLERTVDGYLAAWGVPADYLLALLDSTGTPAMPPISLSAFRTVTSTSTIAIARRGDELAAVLDNELLRFGLDGSLIARAPITTLAYEVTLSGSQRGYFTTWREADGHVYMTDLCVGP